MINKFLAGKKKYSVFLATLLVAAISMFTQDPAQQQELGEMVPMVAMVLSGIVYLIVEGTRDIQREKTNAEYYKAQNLGVVSSAISNPPQNGVTATPTSPSSPAAQPAEPPPEPFDVAAFHEAVMSSVSPKYGEVNPATVYYQARDRGMVTKCSHISQSQDYWDYLVSLAYDAQEYLRQQAETAKGGCQPKDPAFYAMQRDVKHTLQCKDNLDVLAKSGTDWTKALPASYATLYNLGELAIELLGK